MMILKALRENGENKEELDDSREVNKENSFENNVSCDNVEHNNDYWMLALFYFFLLQEHDNEKIWKNFQNDIRHSSRFFPKSELLEKVDNVSVYASIELCEGTVLYRAREYKKDDYLRNKEVVAIYEKLNELFPIMKLELEDVRSDSAMNMICLALGGDAVKMQELYRNIMETEAKEKPFWGFDEKNSDAPPKECAIAGRANPAGISFLYAASDKKTAIMEMRPQIGQYFNVSTIEICRDILIFDFTYTANEQQKDDEIIKAGDLYAISKEFSYPNYGDPEDYIPTQYLCEYLRQKGFDGIRYKSAVSPEGINVIIFDTNSVNKPYKITESSIFEVENIDIKFEQILPIGPSRFQDLQKKSDTIEQET